MKSKSKGGGKAGAKSGAKGKAASKGLALHRKSTRDFKSNEFQITSACDLNSSREDHRCFPAGRGAKEFPFRKFVHMYRRNMTRAGTGISERCSGGWRLHTTPRPRGRTTCNPLL